MAPNIATPTQHCNANIATQRCNGTLQRNTATQHCNATLQCNTTAQHCNAALQQHAAKGPRSTLQRN
eukprot:4967225-Lingulodinium_polyedra.AAC.1